VKRILFVDDEPRILDGLARMLHPLRAEWNMTFARGSEEAIAALEKEPFDAIVSDMRMPVTDGVQFLALVRERWPATIRLVLSGHAEVEASLRAVPVAHQFLSKPCDAETLRETVRRVLAVRDTLSSEKLRATIGGLTSLPRQPRIYTKLLSILADHDYGSEDIARIVETDASLVAKILQMVNSGFFGRARTVTSVKQAVAILGANLIRNVTLASSLADDLRRAPHLSPALLTRQQHHAQLTAGIAHRIAAGTPFQEDAFTAGLLHDVGILILAGHYPRWLDRAVDSAKRSGKPFHEVELTVNPVGHAEAGAYLLGLWALPTPIVEAVACHHHPGTTGSSRLEAVGVVHIASVLAHHARPELSPLPGTVHPELDMPYVESIGVAGRLDEWRAMAESVAGVPERKEAGHA
jgi:HD-like signal output (HDOD) protein/CheY-like chemotaxis protein